jgi:HD-GYP domain-containing protein (c-di-GMP phosphodiesterase class II)
VDAFESMTLGRPYRDSIPEAEALAEVKRCSGTQFDPRVVKEFERLIAKKGVRARSSLVHRKVST